MKSNLLIIIATLFLGTQLMAQGGAQTLIKAVDTATKAEQIENSKNAYGKAVSTEKKVNSMEAKIIRAKAKLAEHKAKGSMPADVIKKKEAQIAAFESKMNVQKAELVKVKGTPRPGKGKGQTKGNVKGNASLDRPTKDDLKGGVSTERPTKGDLKGGVSTERPTKGDLKNVKELEIKGGTSKGKAIESGKKGIDKVKSTGKKGVDKVKEVDSKGNGKKGLDKAKDASKKGLDKAKEKGKAKAKGLKNNY